MACTRLWHCILNVKWLSADVGFGRFLRTIQLVLAAALLEQLEALSESGRGTYNACSHLTAAFCLSGAHCWHLNTLELGSCVLGLACPMEYHSPGACCMLPESALSSCIMPPAFPMRWYCTPCQQSGGSAIADSCICPSMSHLVNDHAPLSPLGSDILPAEEPAASILPGRTLSLSAALEV